MYKTEKKLELRLLELGPDGRYIVKWKCSPSRFKVLTEDEENLIFDYVSGFNSLRISCDLVFTSVHLHSQRIDLLLKQLRNLRKRSLRKPKSLDLPTQKKSIDIPSQNLKISLIPNEISPLHSSVDAYLLPQEQEMNPVSEDHPQYLVSELEDPWLLDNEIDIPVPPITVDSPSTSFPVEEPILENPDPERVESPVPPTSLLMNDSFSDINLLSLEDNPVSHSPTRKRRKKKFSDNIKEFSRNQMLNNIKNASFNKFRRPPLQNVIHHTQNLLQLPSKKKSLVSNRYHDRVMDLQSTLNTWNFPQEEIENEEDDINENVPDIQGFPDISDADPSENEEIQVADKSEEFRDVPKDYEEGNPSLMEFSTQSSLRQSKITSSIMESNLREMPDAEISYIDTLSTRLLSMTEDTPFQSLLPPIEFNRYSVGSIFYNCLLMYKAGELGMEQKEFGNPILKKFP